MAGSDPIDGGMVSGDPPKDITQIRKTKARKTKGNR
jgi:hypothetical protein